PDRPHGPRRARGRCLHHDHTRRRRDGAGPGARRWPAHTTPDHRRLRLRRAAAGRNAAAATWTPAHAAGAPATAPGYARHPTGSPRRPPAAHHSPPTPRSGERRVGTWIMLSHAFVSFAERNEGMREHHPL